MSHLIRREEWADGARPEAIAYFCSVLAERRGRRSAAARRLVRANAVEHLDALRRAPLAARGDARGRLPMGAAVRRERERRAGPARRAVLERQRGSVGPVRPIAARHGRQPPAGGRIRLREPVPRRRLDRLRAQRGVHRSRRDGRAAGRERRDRAPAHRGDRRGLVSDSRTHERRRRPPRRPVGRAVARHRAARDVFDRLIAELDGFDGRPTRTGADLGTSYGDGNGAGPADLPQLRAAVARTIDVYADLFRRTLEVYADVVESVLRTNGPPTPGARRRRRGGRSRRRAGGGGGRGRVDSQRDRGAGRCRAAYHRSHRARRRRGSRRRRPASRPRACTSGRRAGRSSELTVRVPRAAAPGTYVGHVLSTGMPETRLAVCLVVAG